jgi:hypothetical protein
MICDGFSLSVGRTKRSTSDQIGSLRSWKLKLRMRRK